MADTIERCTNRKCRSTDVAFVSFGRSSDGKHYGKWYKCNACKKRIFTYPKSTKKA